jgi:hydroxymethylbilane synthase
MQPSVPKQAEAKLPTTLRLGTRTSKLALWQTQHVAVQLQRHWPALQCELIHMVTQGDKRLDRPLPEIGGKGLFTAELEEALRQGEIDLAVHSLKDLPVEEPADLITGAILSREDTRDVLVAREAWTLATLPQGAVVGTSSLRRQAQLLAARPDLIVRSIRGNVDSRLRKVLSGEYDAAVMAGAGLLRLGLTAHITEWIDPELMLPAPGQGALAVQCRANDPAVQTLLAAIHDEHAAVTTSAERQLLYRLGGGCSAPIGAYAQIHEGQIELRARVASTDGRAVFSASATGQVADDVASQVASLLLAQGAQVALHRETRPARLPLAGKRIVVTRPKQEVDGQANNLSLLLQSAGAKALEIPAIRIVPAADYSGLHDALHKLATYDWIIFTSRNAVEHFWAQAPVSFNLVPDELPRVAAVGPATRAALEAHGVAVDAMPQRYLGTEIVAAMIDVGGDLAGKHALLPRSAQGGRELPTALAEQGASVDEIALYGPVAATIDEDARASLASGVDAITFASGSAVRAFADTIRDDTRFADFWAHVMVACIGPSTAEAAHAAGLPVHVIATEHSMPGLVAALVNYYEQGA